MILKILSNKVTTLLEQNHPRVLFWTQLLRNHTNILSVKNAVVS